jgi:soluble lytic murein transglycosylase
MRVAMKLAVGVLCVLSATTCDAPATRPGASAQPPSSPAPPTFDPRAELRPHAALASVFEASTPELRYQRALAALRDDPPPVVRGRLEWLAGKTALERSDWASARRYFETLGDSDHLLAPWATLVLAEGLGGTDPAASAALATSISADDWAGRDRARRAAARGLAASGDRERAIPLLRALLAETPDATASTAIARPLADLLAPSADVAEREEAIRLYRRIETHAPLTTSATEATEAIATLVATVPPDRAEALRESTIEEAMVRAQTIYDAMQHDESVAAYEAAAQRVGSGPERCEVQLMLGRAILRSRDRARGAAHMETVAAECQAVEHQAAALFNAARAYGRLGRHTDALRLYDRVEVIAPDDSLADDARFRAALSSLEEGNEDGFVERMETLPDRYPEGDMRGDARFMLAWRARRAAAAAPLESALRGEHLRVALRQLEASIQEGPMEDAEDIRGRAAYWRARTLSELGDAESAATSYRALVEAWPLAYYSQQALHRLDQLDRASAAELRDNLGGGARAGAPDEPFDFPWREELDSVSFRRALELFRVREPEMARQELAYLGVLGEGADPDMLWLAAATLDAAGEHPRASRLVRSRLPSFMRTAPVGRAHHLWRLAYPKAFAPLIEEAAQDAGVPAAFVRAVAREESAFDPEAVSVARAYGLIQLIEPTAQRFAREIGMDRVTAAHLRDPAINVRIGVRFIRYLHQRFAANPAVVPAAYNAGEGALTRWLRERGSLPLDEFIEEIPYDETRRYTRRVLQTYGVYSWLDTGVLPPLQPDLPRP